MFFLATIRLIYFPSDIFHKIFSLKINKIAIDTIFKCNSLSLKSLNIFNFE